MVSRRKITSYPLVSVLMPAYNAEKYITQAIESILKQTYKHFELIIVNDYSTDGTAKILQEYKKKDKRIIILKNKKNLKMARTLNVGIEKAKGKYIARMDADDISVSDRLEKQVNFMEAHPKAGILGGSMEIIDTSEKRIGQRDYHLTDAEIRGKIFRYSPFSHPLVMIRKSVLDKVGYYKAEYNPAEDYELYFRIGKISEFANLSVVLLRYRIVEKSMTTGSTKKMESHTIRIRNEYKYDDSYHMTIFDTLLTRLHLLSLYIPIPSALKIRLFNIIRNT